MSSKEAEAPTSAHHVVLRPVVDVEDEKTQSTSSVLPDEIQSTSKRRKYNEHDHRENMKDVVVVNDAVEQDVDEEINVYDQLPILSLKELQEICIRHLYQSDKEFVEAALVKLEEYSCSGEDNTKLRANICCEDIRKNHLIPCITCAICQYIYEADIVQIGLALLTNISAKVSDSLTTESAVSIMNVAVLAMQKHLKNPGIQSSACIVLNNIFEFQLSTIRMLSKNVRVLNLIVDAMKIHPNCEEVQQYGCCALNRYYDFMDNNDRKIMNKKCLIILAKAVEYKPCRKNAARLMRLLSTDIESKNI